MKDRQTATHPAATTKRTRTLSRPLLISMLLDPRSLFDPRSLSPMWRRAVYRPRSRTAARIRARCESRAPPFSIRCGMGAVSRFFCENRGGRDVYDVSVEGLDPESGE